MKKTVYLAGPIAHLDFDEANDWRREAAEFLEGFGARGLSPLRGKEFLRAEGKIGVDKHDYSPLATDSGIVNRDRMDVMNCDIMLANFTNAPKVSVGTAVEFGWADAYRKVVVTVMPKGSPYDHPFTRQLSSYIVETLDEALDLIAAIL